MGGFILPATLPVVTELGNHLHPEIPLFLFVEGLMQKRIVHLWARGNGFDEFHLLRA